MDSDAFYIVTLFQQGESRRVLLSSGANLSPPLASLC